MPLTDTGLHAPPLYESFEPPVVGGSYADPVFGSTVKRLSNALNTHSADGSGNNLTWITDEYPTACPWNSDNSLLLLVHQSYFALYGSSGLYLRDLPMEINASSQPRWSRANNHTFYYIKGNQLKAFDVTASATSIVRTFSEYTSIDGCGESDISLDGDHMVFAGDKRFIFVYCIKMDAVLPAFDTASNPFDSLYLTPKNNVLIQWINKSPNWNASGRPGFLGIELFDSSMHFIQQVFRCNGHKDVMLDTGGSEILVITNSDEPAPTVGNNAIIKVRLSDCFQTGLLSIPWSQAVHISAPDRGEFVYVETEDSWKFPTLVANWVPYCNELLRVPLDGSSTQRLAHHRSRPNANNTYNYEPKISCSRDGSRVAFTSNFNAVARQGAPDEYGDAYMIDFSGPSPVPGPLPPRPHPPRPVPPPAPPHRWPF
jgi:hypothetical protein